MGCVYLTLPYATASRLYLGFYAIPIAILFRIAQYVACTTCYNLETFYAKVALLTGTTQAATRIHHSMIHYKHVLFGLDVYNMREIYFNKCVYST